MAVITTIVGAAAGANLGLIALDADPIGERPETVRPSPSSGEPIAIPAVDADPRSPSRRACGGVPGRDSLLTDVAQRAEHRRPLPAPADHRHRHTRRLAPHPAAQQRSPVRRRSSQTLDPPPDRPAHGTPERAEWKLAQLHAPPRLGTRDPAVTRFYLARTRPRCLPHWDGRPAFGNALDFARGEPRFRFGTRLDGDPPKDPDCARTAGPAQSAGSSPT